MSLFVINLLSPKELHFAPSKLHRFRDRRTVYSGWVCSHKDIPAPFVLRVQTRWAWRQCVCEPRCTAAAYQTSRSCTRNIFSRRSGSWTQWVWEWGKQGLGFHPPWDLSLTSPCRISGTWTAVPIPWWPCMVWCLLVWPSTLPLSPGWIAGKLDTNFSWPSPSFFYN